MLIADCRLTMRTSIPKSTFAFLRKLENNNNREWFNANKAAFQDEYDKVLEFVEALLSEMSKIDQIETPTAKKSLRRIYRDVRFSKDKTPYRNSLWGGMKRATKHLRGGYYYHFEAGGNTSIAGGFFGPNPQDLLRIRKEFSGDDTYIRKILNDKTFKQEFGELKGERVKTAPKGFEKDDPAIDLIRLKQFYIVKSFSDKEVHSEDFLKNLVTSFGNMRPYLDYMSEVLTTDLDGRSTV